MVISKYKRLELTFAKDNKLEQDVFNFIEEQSKIIGKSRYIKNVLYEEMKRVTEK